MHRKVTWDWSVAINDRGATWQLISWSDCTDDDEDWQNLSVVGYGAVVYEADMSDGLWKTTDGGDGTLSAAQLQPQLVLTHGNVNSGSDSLIGTECDTVGMKTTDCKIGTAATTGSRKFQLWMGLDSTQYAVGPRHTPLTDDLADTSTLLFWSSKPGIYDATAHVQFIDDEFRTIGCVLAEFSFQTTATWARHQVSI